MGGARGRRLLVALALGWPLASCAPPAPVVPTPPPIILRERPPVPVPPPIPERLRGEPWIDVGLAWDLDNLELTPERGTMLSIQRVGGVLWTTESAGVLRIRVAPGGAVVEDGRGERIAPQIALGLGDTLWVGAPDRVAPDTPIRWKGAEWRGRFKVFVNPRGKLTLADRLPLETYLLGVVPGEIGQLSDDLAEAGRAQAIAARSYTLFYVGRRASEGFDLYGTVEDQVYGALGTERPIATRCVESTRGRVALSDGQPIRANYCSTCGGITAEVWEAWPAPPLPYLVSHLDAGRDGDYCRESRQYRWREAWPVAEFMEDLARFAPQQGVALPPGGVGRLIDVRIEERSRSGRAWRLSVVTTTGEILIPAYSLRQVLRRPGNSRAILRSNLFKIDVRRDRATRRPIEVVASGAGSGHGVGLCQTGALGMARAGFDAAAILEHYYRGIQVALRY